MIGRRCWAEVWKRRKYREANGSLGPAPPADTNVFNLTSILSMSE